MIFPLWCVFAVSWVTADSDVVTLNKDSFDGFIAGEALTLVEFYDPWCGHCQALAPHYEEAATLLKALETPISIAKVDCSVENELCTAHGAQGFPTLTVFQGGSDAGAYSGEHTAAAIVSHMKKQALPAISILEADKVDAFTTSDKVVIVGFFESTDSDDYATFTTVANKLRNKFVFGACLDPQVATKKNTQVPSIVLFKTFDEGRDNYQGAWDPEAITDFIKANSVPSIDDIGPDNYQSYMDRGLPIAHLFVSDKDTRTTVGSVLEPLAKKFKAQLSFVFVDAEKYGSYGNSLGLKDDWPGLVTLIPEKGWKFPFDKSSGFAAESLESYFQEIIAGNAKPSVKSAALPDSNDEPVKVIVGVNFADIVLDKSKDVLLEIYAPWCGHCKKLAPIFDELGQLLASNPNIVIAKMDGTENDLPLDSPYQVEGFPTLKLYKANDNEIVDYEGNRDLAGLAAFLKKHAVHGGDIKEVEQVEEKAEGETTEGDHDHDHDNHDEL